MKLTTPPPWEFFDACRLAAGARCVRLDLGGLALSIVGLDDSLAAALLSRYGPYIRESAGSPPASDELRIGFAREERDYFIPPPARPEVNPVLIELEPGRLRYVAHRAAGRFETDAAGARGVFLMARGEFEPASRAIENFLRVAVAWRAVRMGGCLVHAASAVHRDRGYLFFGASGAGKSTLAACNRRATIVSDDLSLLLPRPAPSDSSKEGGIALDLVGSPFRGTYEGGGPFVGRSALAAGFRLLKANEGEGARVERVPRAVAFSGLVANLTFVVDALHRRPDVLPGLERAFAGIPLAHLRFRRDDTFWDAIEDAGL